VLLITIKNLFTEDWEYAFLKRTITLVEFGTQILPEKY
jgi:hypothetical protein